MSEKVQQELDTLKSQDIEKNQQANAMGIPYSGHTKTQDA